MNTVPSTKLPKEIILEIDYYQVDKYHKRIIKAGMRFSQFIDKLSLNNGSLNYKFQL